MYLKKTTIKDLAEATGFNPKQIQRYLNGNAQIKALKHLVGEAYTTRAEQYIKDAKIGLFLVNNTENPSEVYESEKQSKADKLERLNRIGVIYGMYIKRETIEAII